MNKKISDGPTVEEPYRPYRPTPSQDPYNVGPFEQPTGDMEVKPCPFCGERGYVRGFMTYLETSKTRGWKYYTMCYKCGIHGPGHHLSIEEAVAAWNRRAGE